MSLISSIVENKYSCVIDDILNDDVLSAVCNSSDDQTDLSCDMDEMDFLSAGSHTGDVISMALDENPMADMYTDVIFPTLDSADDLVFEDGLTPTFSSESGCESSVPPKKKRGRKPKSERGLFIPKPQKPQKTRIYEIDMPFEDKQLERKRICAINAKKHRDSQKNQVKDLEQKLEEAKKERDSLKSEKECLAVRVDSQSKQVEFYIKNLQEMAASSVKILQATP